MKYILIIFLLILDKKNYYIIIALKSYKYGADNGKNTISKFFK